VGRSIMEKRSEQELGLRVTLLLSLLSVPFLSAM
jgi:hypothetical protein